MYDTLFSTMGRIMLCNMGSQGATMVTIFVQAILQGVFRCTIPSRDGYFLSKMSQWSKRKGEETIEEAYTSFAAASIFISMISESFSIIVSGVIYIVFERQRMVFNFGYPEDGSDFR